MRKTFLLAALLFSAAVISADPPAADAPARIRVAGIFIAAFNVWREQTPSCAGSGKPWLKLECGFMKCPKPKSLGIPLELDYTNWRKNPRWTEVEIEAGKPISLHLQGNFARGMASDTIRVSLCSFDATFTPRAGAMYEASLDPSEDAMFGTGGKPPEGGRCGLRLTEIRKSDTGIHERIPIDGANVRNCVQ
jgi:hypothetical protein